MSCTYPPRSLLARIQVIAAAAAAVLVIKMLSRARQLIFNNESRAREIYSGEYLPRRPPLSPTRCTPRRIYIQPRNPRKSSCGSASAVHMASQGEAREFYKAGIYWPTMKRSLARYGCQREREGVGFCHFIAAEERGSSCFGFSREEGGLLREAVLRQRGRGN